MTSPLYTHTNKSINLETRHKKYMPCVNSCPLTSSNNHCSACRESIPVSSLRLITMQCMPQWWREDFSWCDKFSTSKLFYVARRCPHHLGVIKVCKHLHTPCPWINGLTRCRGHARSHTHTYTYTHVRTHIYTHVYIYAHRHTFVQIDTRRMHTNIPSHLCTVTHFNTRAFTQLVQPLR